MYYFVVIEGQRFKLGLRDTFSGLINVHPLKYLENVIAENSERKGYDKVYSGLQVINWQEISLQEWLDFPDHHLSIYKEKKE